MVKMTNFSSFYYICVLIINWSFSEESTSILALSSCSQHRNVTIIVNGIDKYDFNILTTVYLQELLANDPSCFTLNMYSPLNQGFVHLTLDMIDHQNIETKFSFTNVGYNKELSDSRLNYFNDVPEKFIIKTIDDLLSKSRNDELNSKNIFLYLTYSTDGIRDNQIYENLQVLQNGGGFDIVIYCWSGNCPMGWSSSWIPVHRVVTRPKDDDGPVKSLLKNVADLIKNPDFNRYSFYQSIPLKNSFFNATCLRHVKQIHIALHKMNELFLPMAFKIVGDENKRRQTTGSAPLELIFYEFVEMFTFDWWLTLKHLQPLSKHIKVENSWYHPFYYGGTANHKENLFVYVFSEVDYFANKNGLCNDREEFMKKQQVYGLGIDENNPKRKAITDCNNNEIKNTISPDEIFEFMNKDFCK